ncbi:YtzI protein [Bacillus massiliglaciei]|uniref:YtzI protein n=1 Tax=Bacillus massiliglaciei TaxID=1816693 RepID=UPI000DA60026|nr:YtzI protein [Bacillus massiliglaciei]
MTAIIIISILIVLIILALSVLTINKGYSYKHTIEPLNEEPKPENSEEDSKKKENV